MHSVFDGLRELNRKLATDLGINLGRLLFRARPSGVRPGACGWRSAAAPRCPDRVAEFFNDLGLHLLEGYGLTEAGPVLSAAHPDEPLDPGSVGKPLVGIEVEVQTDRCGASERFLRGVPT